MVMLIVGAMVETLVKHMTKNYLEEMDGIKVGGAPSWYMKPVKDQMCVFTHSKGGLGSIDIAKKNASYKMTQKINGLIEVVIYENIGKVKNKKEKSVVDKFKHDDNLGVFVNSNLKYTQVVYEEKIKTSFVRACIPTKTIQTYQKDRLMDINSAVLGAKSSSAFDALDDEFGDSSDSKDEFDF